MVSQWNSSGIFPRIHHIAALQQSPRVPVKNERKARIIYRTGHLHVDVQRHLIWGSEHNEQECDLSAKLVSIYAMRFSPGRWSFLGAGSEKKWYSAHDSKPQGERDRVAELMMVKSSESGPTVFRATSPLPRGTLKSRGGGQGDGVPKASLEHAAADSEGSRTCVCKHPILLGVGTRRGGEG